MFKYRSNKKELLDGDAIPEKDLFQNLKELHSINKLLGGYKITFNALQSVLSEKNLPHLSISDVEEETPLSKFTFGVKKIITNYNYSELI